MENNTLTIKGERNAELKIEKNDFKRIERQHGIFYRRFTMPDDIKASSNQGILTLKTPKQEAAKPQKISAN